MQERLPADGIVQRVNRKGCNAVFYKRCHMLCIQALKGDCSYLWKAQINAGMADTTGNGLMPGTDGHNKIINYYVRKNLARTLWIPVIVFILFLRWLWRKLGTRRSANPA